MFGSRNHFFHFRIAIIPVILFFTAGVAKNQSDNSLRIALFNIKELSTDKLKNVDTSGCGLDPQLRAAAKIIQHIHPDILVINEIDQDYNTLDRGYQYNAVRFQNAYLSRGEFPIEFTYIYSAPCNTGILSGLDLNNDGIIATEKDIGTRAYAGDCFGFGLYPGQYSMALFSKFPIDSSKIRTFQKFLWKDLPGNHLPIEYYGEKAINILRLSSKSHWDIPIKVKDKTVHFFLSHPTPPVFDGEEDRNGRRNFDEIKFWLQYMANDSAVYDDKGFYGGYNTDDSFIIAADLNASITSDSKYDGQVAISQLLHDPNLDDSAEYLVSNGASEGRQSGPPEYYERSTAKFGENFITRVDYIFVSKHVKVDSGAVFWPAHKESALWNRLAEEASDHHLLWLDISL